jgi:hypothetical protein
MKNEDYEVWMKLVSARRRSTGMMRNFSFMKSSQFYFPRFPITVLGYTPEFNCEIGKLINNINLNLKIRSQLKKN